MELLSLIPIIGTALAWRRWQTITAASAILHAVSAILIVLFLGSLLGLLLPVTLLLMIIGTVLAAVEGYRLIRMKIMLPVPFIVLILLCTIFWLIHSGSAYFYYDEYSHWGVFLKEMLATNQLWAADTNSMHPRYLPGTSLWQYFFAVYSHNPEGAAYLAQFVLLITPLLVLWERTSWRQVMWHVGILVLVIVAVTNFGHGFASLFVDHLLGAWFAGIVLNFVLEKGGRRKSVLFSYLLPLAVLVLIKTTGVFFALSASGIMALILLAQDDSGSTGATWGVRLRGSMIVLVATVIVCLSILSIWSINRDATGLGFERSSSIGIVSDLLERESIFDSAQISELTRRYVEVVLHHQISKDEMSAQFHVFSYSTVPLFKDPLRLTTASILAFSLIILFMLSRTIVSRDIRRRWAIAAAFVWLTAVAYVGVLYLGYVYVADNQNGYALSSYVRYVHSMLLPVVLFCFAPLLPAFANSQLPPVKIFDRWKLGRHAVIFTVLLGSLIVFERPYLKTLYAAQQPPEIRTQLQPLAVQLREAIGTARLWVFFPNPNTNGFIGHLVKYQLTPGTTYVEEDRSVLLDSQAALKDELGNWEYAWFPLQNPEFDAAMERLIGTTPTERIFRITGSGPDISFEPVSGIF